ncbi:hypothetical protein HMPREF9336_00791 [Segniliparus rugosus ATCC BAA-974]|uniref:Amidohydrolase-related domain-containing protein n=1 Tax=Segniliparus rugosus (strain ATCC BAA-974 / DSM 45345 / CCUG 50838 / CIP 108380 / JCM 13579 / CDC 945) TaxID=679197 RepID=E5XMS1_SEGRC|nr:hypothetical protein HMPREF9336_00791 [Segniliparus rugosus ATCC BAA-974]
MNQLGFIGAVINGHVNGEYLDNERYWPVLERAGDFGVPVFLHPTRPTQPVIDALHSLRPILAGVFDRFPGLQLILGHLGEFLPAAIDRAESLFSNQALGLSIPVKQTFEDRFWIGVSSRLNTYLPFASALHAIGIDWMLFTADLSVQTVPARRGLPQRPSLAQAREREDRIPQRRTAPAPRQRRLTRSPTA